LPRISDCSLSLILIDEGRFRKLAGPERAVLQDQAMAALLPESDIGLGRRHIRYGPQADIVAFEAG
jgi:hypothetical protein